jgi:hypothetical protein
VVETNTEITAIRSRVDAMAAVQEQHLADAAAGQQARAEEHAEMWRTIREFARVTPEPERTT